MKLYSWSKFDALLRGQLSARERVALPLTWLAWQVLAAALFGASLGVYALTSRDVPDPRYMLAGAVKVPLLLLFTSGITIPSLYVFGALRGLRFSGRELAAHLMVAHTILAAVLGSLAPVLAFFALTTSSYSFMVLLDVVACTIAGVIGVRTFVRTLNEPPEAEDTAAVLAHVGEQDVGEAPRLAEAPPSEAGLLASTFGDLALATDAAPAPTPSPAPAALPAPARKPALPARSQGPWRLLGWWLFLYAFVGTQAGWILRPFIGRPELEFVLLRGKEGGFFGGVLYHLGRFLLGDG